MVVALLSTCSIGMAFAAEGSTSQGNTVPVTLSAPALGDDAGIDFTISDSITMAASAGTTALTISDLVITNKATVGQLSVDSLKATAASGWTIKANDADYFKTVKADTQEFGLSCDTHDFATNATMELADKLVAPNDGTQTFSFTGNIGTFTEAINAGTQVAEIVATVSIY